MRDYLAGWGASLDALRLEHGRAQEVLCRVPSTALLVVHRERGWLKHALWGSVSRAVLADGQADVLLVGDAP
jgi:nucleotide-binding universal stress UspA family protein